jgi:hypothetical protein
MKDCRRKIEEVVLIKSIVEVKAVCFDSVFGISWSVFEIFFSQPEIRVNRFNFEVFLLINRFLQH